jgi:hypothetical protein
MMRISAPLVSLLLAASPALASDGLPSFSFTGAAGVRAIAAQAPAAPAVAGRAADVVTQSHLLARTGRDALVGHADTAEQAAEAAAEWSATLRAAGVTPGTPRYESGVWILPYTAPAGMVLRDYVADPKQFPPKDEAGLRANKALLEQALAGAGLRLVSAKVLNLEYLLPTYSLVYLTRADAVAEKETRLRLLNARDESDFSVFRPHVSVVQVPKPWLMVYVGPQAGVVHMGAVDEAAAQRKLAERRAFLTGQGRTILAERVTPLDDATVKFVVSLYFLY